jgi:hypothetical protein
LRLGCTTQSAIHYCPALWLRHASSPAIQEDDPFEAVRRLNRGSVLYGPAWSGWSLHLPRHVPHILGHGVRGCWCPIGTPWLQRLHQPHRWHKSFTDTRTSRPRGPLHSIGMWPGLATPFVHELTVLPSNSHPVALMGCSYRSPAEASVSPASRIVRLLPSLGFDIISDLMAFVHLEYGTRGVVSTL